MITVRKVVARIADKYSTFKHRLQYARPERVIAAKSIRLINKECRSYCAANSAKFLAKPG